MSFCLVIGREFKGYGELIYKTLVKNGYEPDFILYVLPNYKRIVSNNDFKWYIRYPAAVAFFLVPTVILRFVLKSYFPVVGRKCFISKDINSKKSIRILAKENPEIIILFSCGYVNKITCELFHNQLLSAHAGKLPEFRGVSNVEWAYLENRDLFGSFQFTSPSMDTGDIVYETKLKKNNNSESINQIRDDAFTQLYSLFSKSLSEIQKTGFQAVTQTRTRTTRYKMHPFLINVLKNKLKLNRK
jgi:folate-dependent phosphoribosylglycinamide formyltransferase PurN|tara:strand:- start:92 stop:823 length:732 start_codon:yes stop_codon:yes gene_type:complete